MKKGVCAVDAAMMVLSLRAAAYSQTSVSSAASIQGESPAARVALFLAPPSVMELNGSPTGFSIDLWNAIAVQLKLKTGYHFCCGPNQRLAYKNEPVISSAD